MTRAEDPRLTDIALAIADGTPVNWEALGRESTGTLAVIEDLRLLARLTESHRSTPPAAGGAAEPGAVIGPADGARPPESAWGPLRLREPIGRGSFGTVWRAWDPALQREVALKLLALPDRATADAWLGEARRLARVRHPNVVTIHGADEHDGRVGMWTDLVTGATLEERLAAGGPLSALETGAVGIELCHALAAIHAAGLLHRDLKLANVMRAAGGRIVIVDFGSAGDRAGGSSPAALYGTPISMAPEQLRGESASPASDLYALGVMLYRLASGHHPIEAKDVHELMEKHRRVESVPLRDRRPDLPAAFVAVVSRALEPDPARRYASAGAMERDLAAALGGTAAAPPRPRRARALLLVALALAAGWLAWARPWTRPANDEARRATAPNAPATVAAAPLTASARAFRENAAGVTELTPGDAVSPGDGIFIRFASPESAYVYVLDEDRAGVLTVLFPAPGLDLVNPLAGGREHRLPGTRDGESIDWQVTSAGGEEAVIVIASRAPQSDLERELAALPRPRHGAKVVYGRASAGTAERLRGIAGTVTRRRLAARGGRLSDLVREVDGASAGSDVWTWQIRLANR